MISPSFLNGCRSKVRIFRLAKAPPGICNRRVATAVVRLDASSAFNVGSCL